MTSVVAIIPARLASTRLPGKVLASIGGRPMLLWVVDAARRARRIDAVYVATGDDAVAAACAAVGQPVLRTRADLPSGTDRVAAAATQLGADIVVNVQADEPTVSPQSLDALVGVFSDPGVDFASLMTALQPHERQDPHRVKVWCTPVGDARLFRRDEGGDAEARLHLGIYAYRRHRLQAFARLPPSPLERAHRLEQLRALEQGWPIRMVETSWRGLAVDTPADLARARRYFDAGLGA